jgi:hypothetical protein
MTPNPAETNVCTAGNCRSKVISKKLESEAPSKIPPTIPKYRYILPALEDTK